MQNPSDQPPPPPPEGGPTNLEAIILALGRPTVLIQNDTFPTVPLGPFQKQVELASGMVKKYARSVGRIYAISYNPEVKMMKYFGTGWLINDNIMVTNRHVALCFCSTDRTIQPGIQVKVNFTAEHMSLVTEEAGIEEVLYVASGDEIDHAIDVAILRLTWPDNHPPRVPIPLEPNEGVKQLPEKHPIVVIGHPAYDSRNPDEEMAKYFGRIFDVKRLSPGYAYKDDKRPHNPTDIFHDATTLGGSSGSVILSLVTGKAIGLHYGGVYGVANVAVESAKIVEIVNRLVQDKKMEPLPPPPPPLLTPAPYLEGAFSPEELNERSGYNPKFLQHEVPLPTVRADLQGQLALNDGSPEFKYEHFSIVFNKQRRMAFFTAVNINGQKLVQLRRPPDVWKFDPRIPTEDQLPNQFYSNARREGLLFDRGHLVRRLDPCWGDDEEVKQANDDTFHFTNCTPQHKDLNQKTWLELENYILDRASDNNYLVTVFTGPVLDPFDGHFDGVQIPNEFWKVVVTVHHNNLLATAYIQTQEKLIKKYLEGPEQNQPYGRFKTYQVPIKKIQDKTGIQFPDSVRNADPLTRREATQPTIVEIRSEEDVQLV